VGQKLGGLGVDVHRHGVLEALEDLVGGVLQAGVGLVQLAGGLGGELAELIPVGDVREGTKDEIGTHGKSPDEKGLSGLRQPISVRRSMDTEGAASHGKPLIQKGKDGFWEDAGRLFGVPKEPEGFAESANAFFLPL